MRRRLAPFLLTLAGCGTAPDPTPTTTSLSTAEIAFTVSAQGNGEAVLVSAAVSTDTGTGLALGGGDQLVVSAEGAAPEALSAIDTAGYGALLATTASQVTLSLVRPGEQTSAAIDLPPPFALAVPAGTVSAKAAIPITWDASDAGDAMTLEVLGPCVTTLTRSLALDTGSYLIQPGDLAFSGSGCQLAVSLARSRPGVTLGLGSSGSGAATSQIRTAALEVTP